MHGPTLLSFNSIITDILIISAILEGIAIVFFWVSGIFLRILGAGRPYRQFVDEDFQGFDDNHALDLNLNGDLDIIRDNPIVQEQVENEIMSTV